MVKPVDRIIPDFAKAGATYITFHPEARNTSTAPSP
jgi:ribulose-phosphate 3-epimerase